MNVDELLQRRQSALEDAVNAAAEYSMVDTSVVEAVLRGFHVSLKKGLRGLDSRRRSTNTSVIQLLEAAERVNSRR